MGRERGGRGVKESGGEGGQAGRVTGHGEAERPI